MIDKTRLSFKSLSQREKLLLIIMVAVAIFLFMFISGLYLSISITHLESTLKQNELLLETTLDKKDELKETIREENSPSKRIHKKPEPLGTIIDKAARDSGVTIPELKPQPDEVIGKSWIKHSVQFNLRQEPLNEILDFMVRIENQKKEFPIAITKIEIRRRFAEEDSYDVTMTVSTYEVVEDKIEKEASVLRGK